MRTTTEYIKNYSIDYDEFFDYIKKISKIDDISKYLIKDYMQDDKVCFILKILYFLNYKEINDLREISYTPDLDIKQYKLFKNGDPFLHRYLTQKDIDFYFNFQ